MDNQEYNKNKVIREVFTVFHNNGLSYGDVVDMLNQLQDQIEQAKMSLIYNTYLDDIF